LELFGVIKDKDRSRRQPKQESGQNLLLKDNNQAKFRLGAVRYSQGIFSKYQRRFHTLRSSAERFTVLTGACGTELSRFRGEGRGSIGRPSHNSFKDAILFSP